ncbi:NAD-dependent epimerase/dehydratase family protein [Chondromyces crocatus]|uniref:UDP-glucose 4-epimerase n=1 Tax=Chondromyces crocatus TaxID=52 RepID=A0A0K1EFC7_CHOCO|nr:NAD-dependent epimerase/dehydratase family protein [Chondromyces crocatus]AKT39288.1 epimerase [Chondromyces crocatus]
MRVLVLGGTRFIGYFLVQRLLAAGHDVTLFNRGLTPDPFGARVTRLHGDRHREGLAARLGGRDFDAVVDFLAFDEPDARGAIQALRDHVGHYIMVSTGQVYLVREACPLPATEADYEGPLRPPPTDDDDKLSYDYGIHKRACEDTFAAAWTAERFPVTRLRIPMVEGPRDPQRRVDQYLARLLDGGPLLLPTTDIASNAVRHVYVIDVVDALLALLERPETTRGEAYNVCQQEALTLPEYLTLLAQAAGAPPPRLVPVPRRTLTGAGLDPQQLSPFSSSWMSIIDPTRAITTLGFRPRPLERTLEILATTYLANQPAEPLPGLDRRADELALATHHAGAAS